MIFAREISDGLTGLVKQIDKATAKNEKAEMGSFVVFLNDEEALKEKLEKLAAKEKIQHTILTIDNPAGPTKYRIAKDADVTIVLYVKGVVKANHAFRKGELKGADVDKVLADLVTILPAKK